MLFSGAIFDSFSDEKLPFAVVGRTPAEDIKRLFTENVQKTLDEISALLSVVRTKDGEMKEIKRVEMGCFKGFHRTPEHFAEKEVDIARALESTRQSTRYKAVRTLVDAGATCVTMRGNPRCTQKSITEGFYIFTGYIR